MVVHEIDVHAGIAGHDRDAQAAFTQREVPQGTTRGTDDETIVGRTHRVPSLGLDLDTEVPGLVIDDSEVVDLEAALLLGHSGAVG